MLIGLGQLLIKGLHQGGAHLWVETLSLEEVGNNQLWLEAMLKQNVEQLL